ncbi:hypothetical protein IIA94_00845 [Patescibacteria group bacterium]|nr:hypothetical protein [Patescibacteria group bacterium]
MSDLIALVIFLLGLGGTAVILWRKIPLLLTVKEMNGKSEGFWILGSVSESTKKLCNLGRVKSVDPEKVLHKTLSKTRVLALKTENKTGEWLAQLRKRSKAHKEKFSEPYWDQFKKNTKEEEDD